MLFGIEKLINRQLCDNIVENDVQSDETLSMISYQRREIMKKKWKGCKEAASVLLSFTICCLAPTQALASSTGGPGMVDAERLQREEAKRRNPDYQAFKDQAEQSLPVVTFDVSQFVLPEEAGVLVVVEGTQGSACDVYVYEKTAEGWQQKIAAAGHLGMNGMSSNRRVGDKTTPIGVFKMNTPFGQALPQKGFPEDYVRVDSSYVWSDDTNKLEKDTDAAGEKVGTSQYLDYYDYVLDMGFNPEGIPDQGSALFLHCEGEFWMYSSGCVAVPREQMAEIMKLYGTWGEGRCFIALAPGGTFDSIYHTYGANGGLSPEL